MTQEELAQLARQGSGIPQNTGITGGLNYSQGLLDPVGGYDNSPAAQQRRFDNMIARGGGQYANQPNSPLTHGMEYMSASQPPPAGFYGQPLAASQGSGSSGAYGDGTGGPLGAGAVQGSGAYTGGGFGAGTGGPLRSLTTGGPLISLANNGAGAAQGSGAYTGGGFGAGAGGGSIPNLGGSSPSGGLGNFFDNLFNSVTNNAGSVALGGAGLLAGKEAYDRLGTIGDRAYEGANTIAEKGLEQTQFQPFTVRSSTGSQYGYNPETGEATNTLSPQEQAFQDSMFGGAQGFYDSANQPQGAREQEVFDRIRAMQAPQEERDRMALEQRLFSQGRSGVSTNQYGGTPEQLAQAKAQAEAQNQASLMAMSQAQAEQMQNANLGSTYLASSYLPQGQLSDLQLASQMFPQLQQRGQLSGAGMFGEASMGGLEALLGAGQGQANLMGMIASGLLSGAFR